MKKNIVLIFINLTTTVSFANTWKVGPTRTYTKPSQVSTLVSSGDTVDIDAGVYASDVARWSASNLLLRGVNGMASLPSGGLTYGGKAIWVIAGNNTTVEHVEFSQAACVDKNGAGIRQEGRNLTVRYCSFHDNEDGILAGTVNPSNILIEYTEFGNNGYGDGYSHNLYINNIDTLVFQYNYTHHAKVGHELKSRAHVNFILYNRLSNESNGTASRCIDLPNGGVSYVIGNVIEQGPLSQNSNLVEFGLEGLTNPAPHEFYAINNTLVNDRSTGSFFAFQPGTALFKGYNNILAGSGSFITGTWPTTVDTASNRVSTSIASFSFANASQYDYHLTVGSLSCINKGTAPGMANTVALNPADVYVHPHSMMARCSSGVIDVGAYEYCASVGVPEISFSGITIYPNPAHDYLTIAIPAGENFKIEIFSVEGKRILELFNERHIDINGLRSGIYFLKISTGETTLVNQVVKF